VRILVFTDNDLDGAGSALFIKWLFKSKLSYLDIVETTETTFHNDFREKDQTLDSFDRIFVLDLDLTEEQIKLVDRRNVIVIDHHTPHVKKKGLYTTAKAVIEEYSSCTKLLQDKFTSVELTPAQEELLTYIDDYDCYKLEHKDSLKLNAIHHTLNRPKVNKFIDAFEDGFRPYTIYEKNSIKLYIQKFREQVQNDIFIGNIKDYKVVSIMANYAISEVTHFIINKYQADIGISVNIDTKTVSFRRCKTCTVDVSILAKTFCGGGGSAAAAGGNLTPEFANLTKNFLPC
jgi:oligoribonuclease NrnB/cAMP/cGMP phosphodiesterase (DHH superfamily)